MAPSAVAEPPPIPQRDEPWKRLPPPTVYPVKEARFEKYIPPQLDGRERALAQPPGQVAIVIDNGSHSVRAGWNFEDKPRLAIPPIMSKYRDRKMGKTFSFAGSDCYADTTARSHIRNAFEAGTGIVSNWDVMEHVLDYVFVKLGMNECDGAIDMPIVMTEAVANLPYSRKSMSEIIFECYGAPSLVYGIDSLFSFRHNQGQTGLVVSSSYSATHVIPVYNRKALLSQAIRLNWGGWHMAEYMLKLLKLKYYTGFPGKLNSSQTEHMVRDFCYVSLDYDRELAGYLDWTGLEDRERIVQYPYTEEVVVQKTEEELARIAERKKESGRRLQEQAAKMRLERLMKKEQELEYYKDIQRRMQGESKKEIKRLLDEAELKDEAALERVIRDLERSIKRARQKDLGEPEEEEVPDFSLLDVPDDQLDEAGLRQKRQQRLLKSNWEARQRAKAEKEAEKARLAEEARLDEERRKNDLEGWLEEKRQLRLAKLNQLKERERLKADLGNRKSLASQIRMKNIANLASDNPTGSGSRKRRRGGAGADQDDDFGADDADWGVYRSVAIGANKGDDSDDEEGEEDLEAAIRSLENDLLRYDKTFSYDMTLDAQRDWSKSLLHAFRYGPRPFDPSSQAETHRVHLNVERIRVPEVLFQPAAIAGVDQAGLVEIAGDILCQRLPSLPGIQDAPDAFLRDVFLTGGNTLFQNFDERLRQGLMALLPVGAPLRVRRAQDAILDAWRGAAGWACTEEAKAAWITREEYLEKGGEYIKEHDLGNAFA
nr:Chain J, Arp5 [Thermochaetoides thermophila DSM 1495]8AV6_J Chain J, DASH complex subunit DAD4 [Thermochaetoides thermophila]8OO7_J Chain J, Actin-related protein 5 [Thermochaetoides thermophila]8OOC_J Chain J, DASH complex subunit DAD4 [Thermochaetoides thermophila]8OOF_J Chain J, Actin-related protein 5 [Thermochaetoides thermophila]8OOK_J Chain J, Actin-related protein 5 [Thermochaetoides thermophila]8OOP_J Chain J, Actin-related protein 5 [Thermochaetoides thermophila]8OOR_J Chain J, 